MPPMPSASPTASATAHELEVAKANAARPWGRVDHLVVEFDYRKVGGSALTSDIAVPKEGVGSDIPVTYVPARNTIFLSFALGWAEVLGAFDIFIGVNALDYSGYPDCRPEYIAAFETMANLATKAGVEGTGRFTIHTPLIQSHQGGDHPERAGPRRGLRPYPLLLRSRRRRGCACGLCDSCRLRLKGFAEAGIPDPVRYAVKGER